MIHSQPTAMRAHTASIQRFLYHLSTDFTITMQRLYSKEMIAEQVRRLGQQISQDYLGQTLVLVVVLKGALLFAADLARQITVPLTIDFLRVSSYGDRTESSGTVTFKADLDMSLRDKHVIIVDDIIDSGRSMQALANHLQQQQPASLKSCVLIDKKNRRQVPITADYSGIEMDDGFIIGYGLDFDEHYRNLDAIYLFDPHNHPGGEA